MADGKPTFGTILKLGLTNPPTTTLGKRVSIGPPKRTREAVDVTDHDSPQGAQEFIPDGVFNPGTVEIEMNYVAGDADDDLCNAMFAAGTCFISWTSNAATATETFGPAVLVITSYGENPKGTSGKQTATLTGQISGVVAQAPTA
jgi:hypothetical protein